MLRPVIHTLAVLHHTVDVAGLATFLRQWLGFEDRESGAGFHELSNGAMTLRLLPTSEPGTPLELEAVTEDLPSTARFVAEELHLNATTAIETVGPDRFEQRFATPWGLVLVLTQKLSLDELGIPVAVPQTLDWESSAVKLVQEVLTFVPRDFRAGAQRRVAQATEARVLAQGRVEVGEADAVAGLLGATPNFQLQRLRLELASRGFGESEPGDLR